jgi:undecaprenyl diphosphate synthase
LRFAGRLEDLPEDIREILRESEEATRDNDAITVVICINYGGRQEVLDAVNRILAQGTPGPVDDQAFRRHLYLPDLPDPDLLIRSSGELRMSNFWLYQGAYSEYYFSSLYWPDFGPEEFEKALRDYAGRERRYGDARAR